MSTLFNTVIREEFLDKQNFFWGERYKLLNSLKEKSEQDIFNYQLSKLKSTLDSGSSLKGYSHARSVYEDSLKNVTLLEAFYNEQLENTVSTKMMTILNAPFKAGEFREQASNAEKEWTYTDYKKVGKATAELSNEIKSNIRQYGYGAASLNRIQKLQKSLQGKKINIHKYIQEKAAEAEYLTAEAIEKSDVFKDYKAVVTGLLEREGSGQLIQDVMTFSKKSLQQSFKQGPLSYKIQGQTYFVDNLQELLIRIEKEGKNRSHHFILSEELYSALTEASVLSVQTKSGIDQKIINDNKRRQVILDTLLTNNPTPPAKALKLLKEIETFGRQKNISYFKNDFYSPEIQSWANYILGKDIAKLLHFGKDQVHLLFTDHGFETPYAWMKRTNMFLKFDKIINNIDSSFGSVKRYYNLQKR